MSVKSLHHVAYRCNDAAETVEFYTKALGLKYTIAVSADSVPSTKEECLYMHVFFEMDDGNYVAFFEVPNSPPMGFDPNTPGWVQHLALRVGGMEELNDAKARLEGRGLDVIGPVDHEICQSIYFHDPNGHRLELTYDTTTREMAAELAGTADSMLADWNAKKAARGD